MMKTISTTIGSYPRPDWFKTYLRSNEGLQKSGKKDIDKEEYERAVSEVLEGQKNAGIQIPTDGQLLWQNMLCHLCAGMDGVEMGGLIRYFDNNMYYQKPKITGKIGRSRPLIIDEFKTAHDKDPNTKAVLSCFTLAELSKNAFYKDKKELVMDIAAIMNEEAKDLAKAGAKYIQVDEPSLLYAGKDDVQIAKEAVATLTKGVDGKFFLATYFTDAEKIFPEVIDFNVDVIGLDFVDGFEKNLELLKQYPTEKQIQAGIVDGRTTKMEQKDEIGKKLSKIKDAANSDTLYISPNTGIEFLPYSKATEKLSALCAVAGGEE